MKGFNRLLFIAIIFAIFYYVGWKDDPKSPQQSGNQSPPQQAVQIEPVKVPADSLTRKNFVLIFDGSGSMAGPGCSGDRTKYEVAREAVIEWAASVPEDANLGLLVFDRNGFSTRLPLGLANRPQFKEEIEKVVPDNKNPLTLALDTAYDMLTEQGRKQSGNGEYTVVIVTDGGADDINSLAQSVDVVLTTSPITIHTIGFCISGDHPLNLKGRTSYLAANNPSELRKGLQEVLAGAETSDSDSVNEQGSTK